MKKSEEIILAQQIIQRFRVRPEWRPNHSIMAFNGTMVGYYDTKEEDEYFVLKYDDIEFTAHNVGYAIDFKGEKRFSTFDLIDWLRRLDTITRYKPLKVIIEGVEYKPVG